MFRFRYLVPFLGICLNLWDIDSDNRDLWGILPLNILYTLGLVVVVEYVI